MKNVTPQPRSSFKILFRQRSTHIFTFSILFLIAVIFFIGQVRFQTLNSEITSHSKWARQYWPKRVAFFKKNPLQKGEIVFLGDSITEHGENFASLVDLKSGSKIRNRGISGDTSEGVLARLDEILLAKPQALFLMIGINDLLGEVTSPAGIVDRIQKICTQVFEFSPDTKVWVQTLLPTDHPRLNAKVQEVNQKLKKICEKAPQKLLNLYPAFLGDNGLIKSEFSYDGIHLTPEGYELWGQLLKPALRDLNL